MDILEFVSDGIIITDKVFRILRTNGIFRQMSGFTMDELNGRPIKEILPHDIFKNGYNKNLETQKIPVPMISKSGESLDVEFCLNLLNDENSPESYCISVTDVTIYKRLLLERKKLENQIKLSRKLETLGILSGGIAHDFNNLLVSVLGNADLALCKMEKDSPVRSCVNNIKTASIRASELTNQMLSFTGERTSSAEPVNLNFLVEEMTNLLKVSIPKNIMLSFTFDEKIPAVEGDKNQLMQVVMNLITNASQAIGDTFGTIKVKTGIEEFSGENLPPKRVFIEVKDSGQGIGNDNLSKIFEPFFTTKPAGRGLGLSIVKEIVENHKGIIEVKSKQGEGTAFRISFPASDKALPEKKKETVEALPEFDKGLTVLVIDDEEDVREVTGNILETLGINAITASNGHDGIRLLRDSDKIDLIIVDLTMPNMNGAEVYNKIRETGKDIPIIVSSGYSENDTKNKFDNNAEFHFIHKPYQMNVLAEMIQKAVKGEADK